MNRKLTFIVLCLVGFISSAMTQTLGEFSPKESRGALGPRKFPSKDIYIANFSVNFQVYNLRTANTSGGFSSGTLLGKTSASLTVGLDIPLETIQKITDDAYQQLIQDLTKLGFNVLNVDVAKNTKYYQGYERVENMPISISEAPGMITVFPRNVPKFIKGYAKDGKIKKEGMLQFIGLGDRADQLATYTKLSNELNDATILDANLFVLFLDVKKPYQGNGAKLTANTNLRISSSDHIKTRIATNTNQKSFGNKVGLTAPGTKEITIETISAIDFIAGRNKIGGSPLGTYSGILKKDLKINEVIGEEKVQAYAKTDSDYIGTETAFGKMYRADNVSVENTAVIKAPAEKYRIGVYNGICTFLSHHCNEFKEKFF